MANNADILGDEAAVRQIVVDDFSATNGHFEDDIITNLRERAFSGKASLTSVKFSNLTRINQYAFSDCNNLSDVGNLDNVVKVGQYAFRNCSKLGWLCFPSCTQTESYMFYGAGIAGCGVVFPALTGACTGEFMRSSNYSVCDLGEGVTALGTRHFYDGRISYTIILRNPNAVVTAADTTRLGIKNDSVVYVPSALVSAYQTATNWSTKYAQGVQFLPIEGSQYENYYADGTPIPTT